MLGQSTNIERSTVEQVRAKIARLREETREAQGAKAYDFDKRLAQIKAKEDEIRAERKAKRKALREAQRMEIAKSNEVEMAENDDMAHMMGFSGFGTTKK
jgi:U4/U6.U5 tri-snRNP component SNU23